MPDVFASPVFFIVFRESLETSIIVSILLAFLAQAVPKKDDAVLHRRLAKQVWLGTIIGAAIILIIAAAMIAVFYKLGTNAWAASENVWEGVFAALASVIITLIGAALLRVSKLQEKWQAKLRNVLDNDGEKKAAGSKFKKFCEKYAFFFLPLVTILREGLEAVIFIAGVGLSFPATAFPLPTISGILAGCLIGYGIYKGSGFATLRIFLIITTCFLYLIAAGLLSKAVWLFEMHSWSAAVGGDAAETGVGAGSYDITQSVWHVNCCSPKIAGGAGWGVFNSLFGWQNSATRGSVISYNLYWVVVISGFLLLSYKERKGRWPWSRKTFQSQPELMTKENESERTETESAKSS